MKTFLFYDIETTGLHKAFDQVLQFAAIRTDLELNELTRHELIVKLNPDTIPSPAAMITHHMRLADIAKGISEFDAIKQIHQWLNYPGTISVGYNTLGFDDEFLRFSFFRNLLPPYTHQYANDCGRMDLYPITVMYSLFKRSILEWPEKLKLEQLNTLNQLSEGRAHHAMVDVEATLALAKRFFKEREMWDYLVGYFNKNTDNERTQSLKTEIALLFDGIFGTDKNYHCPVLYIGNHEHYKNQSLWLRLDTTRWETLEKISEKPHEFTRVIFKKPGEPNFVLPLKERFLTHLAKERLELAEQNRAWLNNNPEIFQQIIQYYKNYQYTAHPETDVNASLYLNGFWSAAEENTCRAFHKATPFEKRDLVRQITNPRLKALALRILGRHFQEHMTNEQNQEFSNYLSHENIFDYQGNRRLTSQQALADIEALRKQPLSHEQTAILDELALHLQAQNRNDTGYI